MAKSVFARDADELIHQQRPQAGAAEGGIDHPLDAAGQAERAAVAAVQRRVGYDAVAVERQQWKDLRVVDVAAPAFDQRPVLDVVPRETAIRDRQMLEELVQR